MEILGNKKYGIREICRAFRVPPSKISDGYNHAYNAGETENVGFLTDSIDAILTKIEQEVTVKLLGDSPIILSNYVLLFDREKMFTVNTITKADYYTKMIATGAWSVNDIRAKENMPAVEGGDVALISCNVAPLTSAKITGEEKSEQPLQ
jgi:HK97 family phage portal protein